MKNSTTALLCLRGVFAAGLMAPALFAQDTRTVTEPVIPPACTVLDARLVSGQRALARR